MNPVQAMRSSGRSEPRARALVVLTMLPVAAGCDVTYVLELHEAGYLFQAVVGATLQVVANIVYIRLKGRGDKSFGRLVAFWIGLPWSWISFFMLPEGHVPAVAAPKDDEEALFREVRKDRMLREVAGDESGRRASGDRPGPESA